MSAIDTTSAATGQPQAAQAPEVPVVRITPPTRWWVLPLAELWEYRELLYFYVWRELKVRYKQTVVGAAWAVIQPLMTMLVFSLFFGKLAHIPSGGLPYPVFYYSALLPWMYFAGALQERDEQSRRKSVRDHESLFPALDTAFFCGALGTGGFWRFVFDVCRHHDLLQNARNCSNAVAATVFAAGSADGPGRGPVALGAQRDLPRRALRGPVFGAVLDVRLACGLSQLARPAKWRPLYGLNPMAGVIEGFRWSLSGTGNPPGPHAPRVVGRGSGDRGYRHDVFSKNGIENRRRSVTPRKTCRVWTNETQSRSIEP